MNSHHLYAFYGSLRQGMSNHARYKAAIEILFKEAIRGYRLYAMEHYPYAVKTENPKDELVVEVCQVTDLKVEQSIHELELGVGYYYDEVLIRNKPTGIYLFREGGSEPLVSGGDWVKFFRP